MRWSELPPRHNLSPSAWAFSMFLLSVPTVVLGLLAYRTHSFPVAVGAGVEGLFLLVFLRVHPVWRPPISVSVVILYLIALVWAWLPLRTSTDWAPHVAQGVLLLVGVVLLATHDLTRTGAEPLRRANKWASRIKSRRRWPAQLADCRVLPEAVGLRNAIRDEPGPALALLSDPRPEVQTTALGALEYRPHWRAGEAEFVLKFGRDSHEPAVRAAATYALAGASSPDLIAGLASFLRDPAPEVRLAAAEAIMWEGDSRWPYARDGVREAMADPILFEDGPLFAGIGRLPAAAVADMFSWSAEHPPLAHRAILTLINHYNSDLVAAERPELASELATMMLDAETPPALRVELASLLRDHHLLSADLLDRLTNLDQPGPMRLFAAELMLRINPHDPDGIDVLRGLARQPNRELAVQIAAVLQSVLGLNLGLPEGELPASNSKQASDIARRVLSWANGANPDILHPTPGPRGGLQTASRHSLPAIGSRASITGIPPMPVPGGTPPPVMPAASVLPMDESAMLPMDESAMIPMRQPAASSSDESAIISSRQPAASPSDESSIIPHRPPSVSPMDESSMIPKEEMPEDTVPVQVPIPPPLPKRPPPRPGSSAVI